MENEGSGGDRAGRFAAYLADLASVLGDARRYAAMVSYCTGLLLPSERKSVEPMAAMTVDNAGRHARCFWDAIRKRLEDISLSLHPDKTRLIEFGRDAARRAQRGLGKPETFESWASCSSAGIRARPSSSLDGNPGAMQACEA